MTLLFNQYERAIIKDYRAGKYKPLVVSRFEMAQAKRNFARGIEHYLKPIVEFLNRVL